MYSKPSSLFTDSIFLRVLRGEPVSRTPVWIMRQAGRYLPEYRLLREKAGSFMHLCQSPELACEITLQPLKRFPLDAAILFSDILTIPDSMGLGLSFIPGEGPRLAKTIRTPKDVDTLALPPKGSLDYVARTISLIRRELAENLPLIGFAGSPWTVATYMIEGKSSRTHTIAKSIAYQSPALLHQLLKKVTRATIDYLNMQIASGVQAVMIFDSWGGTLSPQAYIEFSLYYMREILRNLQPDPQGNTIPTILFSKGGGQWLSVMADSQASALGIDWTTSLKTARAIVGDSIALQGNLDPTVLLTTPNTIRAHVAQVLSDYGYGHRHIFNLGHGITPEVSIDNVHALLDAVHELSPVFHSR